MNRIASTRRRRAPQNGDPLTGRQMEALTTLVALASIGISPTYRELAVSLGVESSSTVHYHVHMLAKKGYIDRRDHKGKARCILVTTPDHAEPALLAAYRRGYEDGRQAQ